MIPRVAVRHVQAHIVLLAIATVPLFSCASTDASKAEPRASASDERALRWQEDLAALVNGLSTKHKDPFFKTPREEFEAAAADLHARISRLPDWRIVIELQMLTAMLRDSHTSIRFGGMIPNTRMYPLRLIWLKGGLFVRATDAAHADLLEARLVRVGAFSVEEAAARVARIAAVENRASFERAAMSRMRYAEFLEVCGVVEDMEAAPFTLQLSDGDERTVTLRPLATNAEVEWQTAPDDATSTLPVSMRERERFYGFEPLSNGTVVYCWYDKCKNDPARSVGKWTSDVLRFVDKDPVRRVIIDVRRNRGGNSILLWPMMIGLRIRPKVNHPGGQIVLIDRGTFSSADMNAEQFKKNNRAVLIGSPTGQKPNGFGEVRTFVLPHSKLTVGYSTKYFKRSQTDADSLMPDVLVETTAAEFFAGRDPVLEAALEYTPN